MFFHYVSRNRVFLCIVIAIAIVGIVIFVLVMRNLEKKAVAPSFPPFVGPNPFPGLPEITVTSTGIITSKKSDWQANETPTFQIDPHKLPSQ